jgi:pimeloyl-ACP methyl ester carboxylesterase
VSRRRLLYFHGFASSPRSSKARFFGDRARAAGMEFVCPDLNLPSFSALTVTRMIGVADTALDEAPGPVTLVGSSLGAFVALHAAARRASRQGTPAPVDGVVLLAPALELAHALAEEFGPEKMAAWESTGVLPVFHYGDNAMKELGWSFMRDVRQYDTATADARVPTLIYQGSRDDVVSPAEVARWAAGRPNVALRMVEDGHQLLDHLETMWADVVRMTGAR